MTEDGHNYVFGQWPEMPWKKRKIVPENIYKPREDSQTPGLEWIYCGVFGLKTDGAFVEVGANDGISWSNTYFLAQLGWRGLYVEPIEHLHAKCVANHKDHPNVQVAKCAVGDGSEITMMQMGDTDYLYTGDPVFAELLQANKVTGQFKTVKLDNLLDSYKIPEFFDLLVIDVEGMEKEVLIGFDIDRWLPKLVIIETCELHTNAGMSERAERINSCFYWHQYVKIYTSSINTIFLRR